MTRPIEPTAMRGKPVSARVDPIILDKIKKKHPETGAISVLIRLLLQKYAEGKIFGIKIEIT